MSAAREQKARAEARIEAAPSRLDEVLRLSARSWIARPSELAGAGRIGPRMNCPTAADIERRLEALKQDRERLGAVNLRAKEELNEAETAKAGLAAEHARSDRGHPPPAPGHPEPEQGRPRTPARRLRQSQRPFRRAVHPLFGGGTAALQLVESDDPLEAGLEILARPPGKKPQVMTLLSGGEQALTALSLIFAIFLTNPSPICVLDEVDAPLDDANVERFCDLLDDMRRKTETRFIVITHNPITMARMNRLFGVTMAERGVSQLVSVDLEDAERMLDAG